MKAGRQADRRVDVREGRGRQEGMEEQLVPAFRREIFVCKGSGRGQQPAGTPGTPAPPRRKGEEQPSGTSRQTPGEGEYDEYDDIRRVNKRLVKLDDEQDENKKNKRKKP